jgi:hypothetical protein
MFIKLQGDESQDSQYNKADSSRAHRAKIDRRTAQKNQKKNGIPH